MGRVVVVGSINVDVVVRAAHFPSPGETVRGSEIALIPGGKGANQAVAASRVGASVVLVGALGSDPFGEIPRAFLTAERLDMTLVTTAPGPTGVAVVVVDERGDNSIVVVAGANDQLTPSQVAALELGSGDVLLLQNEVPAATNLQAIHAAERANATVVVNLAPLSKDSIDLPASVRHVIVNEREFAGLTGYSGGSREPSEVTEALAEHVGADRNVLVTLGSKGAVASIEGTVTAIEGHEVLVADTTGAGDAFCGAYGAALARDLAPLDAARFANAAAALSVGRPGAGPSMPTLDQVIAFLGDRTSRTYAIGLRALLERQDSR